VSTAQGTADHARVTGDQEHSPKYNQIIHKTSPFLPAELQHATEAARRPLAFAVRDLWVEIFAPMSETKTNL
jgi:hypothetical protein